MALRYEGSADKRGRCRRGGNYRFECFNSTKDAPSERCCGPLRVVSCFCCFWFVVITCAEESLCVSIWDSVGSRDRAYLPIRLVVFCGQSGAKCGLFDWLVFLCIQRPLHSEGGVFGVKGRCLVLEESADRERNRDRTGSGLRGPNKIAGLVEEVG